MLAYLILKLKYKFFLKKLKNFMIIIKIIFAQSDGDL